MTPPEVLDALCAMTAGELDYVVAKLALPTQFLSGAAAAPATRAAEVVRALEAHGRLAELEAMLRPAGAVAPSRALEVSIARLPATSRELFGREAERAWLDRCWNDGAHVASIVAFGGVGKSALVNTWLAGVRDDGWRGAARVYGWSFYSQGTDRLTSSDEFFDAALRWFGDADPAQRSPWDKGERLAALVRKERTLLILDGVEPLQWGPGVQEGKLKDPALEALVKDLGAQNIGLCLITSRIVLADLEALGGDKVRTKDLAHLSPEAGAELLAARGAKGTDEEMREATREYKGHGLALTLLGSYLADVAEGDIRRRREIGPLEEDERQGGHARRVMVAYERWLGKPEVAILHIIGLFDRPVEEDEIAALRATPVVPGLTDELVGVDPHGWNRAVAKLKRVGLLSEEQDKRLDAHPLVREHFEEQLRREQPEAWREGHRRLYEHLKGKAKELPETVEEMRPLYEAVVHGCLGGLAQRAHRDVFRSRIQRGDDYFSTRILGACASDLTVLSAFFDPPWERLVPGLSEPDQAFVLTEAGFALRALGRLPEAVALMRMALDWRIAERNWKDAASVASDLSQLLRARGELREALTLARTSVELADDSGDAFKRMANRTRLAAVQHAMGLRDEAAAQFEEAERMQKERQPACPLLFSLSGGSCTATSCSPRARMPMCGNARRSALRGRWRATRSFPSPSTTSPSAVPTSTPPNAAPPPTSPPPTSRRPLTASAAPANGTTSLMASSPAPPSTPIRVHSTLRGAISTKPFPSLHAAASASRRPTPTSATPASPSPKPTPPPPASTSLPPAASSPKPATTAATPSSPSSRLPAAERPAANDGAVAKSGAPAEQNAALTHQNGPPPQKTERPRSRTPR